MNVAQSDNERKSIEVIALNPLANAGNLKAFVSIKLDGVVIHDCRIVQQAGQRPWVSLPQESTSRTVRKSIQQ